MAGVVVLRVGFSAEEGQSSNRQVDQVRAEARVRLLPPARIAPAVAVGLVEVLGGRRSSAQLERLMPVELWPRLARLDRSRRELGRSSPRVLRVHVQEDVPGLADAVVVLALGERVIAVAMRLDARRGSWLVTELAF